MESISIGIIAVRGIFALLLFLVFSYLYQQAREPYFRAWQMAWAAYSLQYALLAWTYYGTAQTSIPFLLSTLLFCAVAAAIYVSTRLVQEDFELHWSDAVLGAAALALIAQDYFAHVGNGVFRREALPHLSMELGVAALLAYCALRFFRIGRQRDSIGFRLLAGSLACWVPLLAVRQFPGWYEHYLSSAGPYVGPLPEMMIGTSMVVVMFEHERRLMQENALAFSTLDVDSTVLLARADLAPALEKVLHRILRLVRADQGTICISEPWRAVLPSVSLGFPEEFVPQLEGDGSGEYLTDMAYRRGGLATFRNLPQMTEPLPAGPPGRFDRCKALMTQHGVTALTAISLQTRDNNFGVVLFPHSNRTVFGSAQVRLLLAVAMQIGMTLENYVVMHDTKRRTREYELLTQMGQVISSRLDPDEVLRSIHKELGLLFDTETFYVAFLEDEELRFEFECIEGEIQPKRARKAVNGAAEYVIRTAQPLLVTSDMEKTRARLGITYIPERPAKSYCAVPIFMNNRSVGVLTAMNFEREFPHAHHLRHPATRLHAGGDSQLRDRRRRVAHQRLHRTGHAGALRPRRPEQARATCHGRAASAEAGDR